jgi:hypothetical protein
MAKASYSSVWMEILKAPLGDGSGEEDIIDTVTCIYS